MRISHLCLSLLALFVLVACESSKPAADPDAAKTGAAGAPAGEPVSGVVRLSKAASVEPGNVLYIIAKKGTRGGPPAAVKRVANPQFPVRFTLGPEDSMVPGIAFEGPLQIKARLSRTGDAMPHAGDIEGFYPDMARPGDTGIEILLAREL